MQFSKAELSFSKKRDQFYIAFIGKASLDTETSTFVRQKEFVWDDEEEFEEFKEALGL
jgi:hypothetical protein